jgi:drug/metabolite transporter (DMT)-like permease
MSEAIALNILLGLVWATIGTLMAHVARRGGSVFGFYMVGTAIASVASWAFLIHWPVLLAGDVPRLWDLVVWSALAGMVNGGGQATLVSAMRRGHRGLTWAISQSAMAMPFLASFVIFQERVALVNWIGFGLILLAIATLTRKGDAEIQGGSKAAWLALALGALAMIGSAQTLFGVPSRWEGFQDVARLRVPVAMSAAVFVHAAVYLLEKTRLDRRTVSLAGIWAAEVMVAFMLLFHVLDRMEQLGRIAIVYPLGVGTCIAAFTLYCAGILRERFTWRTAGGIALSVIGIGLLSVR